MQHIIVHGKNNPYSDLYLIILMMCPCVPVVIYIPCVPVVICVPVSQFVISLWVSRSSFIFPVSRSSFVSRSVISIRTIPVSRSSFIYPACAPGVPVVVVSLCPGRHLYSLCPGRDLCPGVPVCNFSLRFPVVTYIPSVSVVICVPVCNFSLSVFSF